MSCYFCGDKHCITEPNYEEGCSFNKCNNCGRYVIPSSEMMRWQTRKLDKDVVAAFLYHNVRLLAEERDPSYTCVVASGKILPSFLERHPHYHVASYEDMQAFYPKTIADRTFKVLKAITKKSLFPGDQIEMNSDEAMSLLFIRRFDKNGNALEENDINMQYDHIIKHFESRAYASISSDGFGKIYMRLSAQGQEYIESIKPENAKPAINSSFLSKKIDELLEAEKTDNDADAIGKSKELIESCCRTILDERGGQWKKDWSLQELTAETMGTLGIRARDIQGTDDITTSTKSLLGNLSQIAQRVSEIRNFAGSGHGRSESFKPVEHRYAQVAVDASIALVRFLWDAHKNTL